jgi:dipeptidyl aminopeptidase/acylaminoacyl peptidase
MPAIIVVHGWTPYNTRGGEAHTYFAKEIAQQGFITLAITLRGWQDTGGTDDCGLMQPIDLVNAVKWLANHPEVDGERIGLLGQSLGGQVALSAGAIEQSIKAIVAYFPVTDFRMWGETTNHHQSMLDDYIYGMCAEEGTPDDRSPILVSDKIRASVLFMHGDQDKNVILRHSSLMYNKMLARGQLVKLFVAVGGGHGSFGTGWEDHFNYMIRYFKLML